MCVSQSLRYSTHNSILGRQGRNYSRLAWVSLDKNIGLNMPLLCVTLIINALVIAILVPSRVVVWVLAVLFIGVFCLIIAITDFRPIGARALASVVNDRFCGCGTVLGVIYLPPKPIHAHSFLGSSFVGAHL